VRGFPAVGAAATADALAGIQQVSGQVCKRIDRRLGESELPDATAHRVWLARRLVKPRRLLPISISQFFRDHRVFDPLRRLERHDQRAMAKLAVVRQVLDRDA